MELLRAIAPAAGAPSGPVFVFANPRVPCPCVACTRTHCGAPIQSIKRTFATAGRAIGRPEVTFHHLRHTVASWLLNKGYGLKVVQKILNHADLKTTSRYAHLELGAEAAAMADALTPDPAAKVGNKSERNAA